MTPSELQKLKQAIEHLPKKVIYLVGVGISRTITLDGETLSFERAKSQLPLSEAETFNWGYVGSGPKLLALSIMDKLLFGYALAVSESVLDIMFIHQSSQYLATYIIPRIEENNFTAEFRIYDFLKDCMLYTDSGTALPENFGADYINWVKSALPDEQTNIIEIVTKN